MAGVVHLKLHIQQNKALLFQVISKINVFSIATIIQPDNTSWVVFVIQKIDFEINRLWPLIPMNRFLQFTKEINRRNRI